MALIRWNGGVNIRFDIRDPDKAHPCAEPRVLAYFALAVASCKNRKKNEKN